MSANVAPPDVSLITAQHSVDEPSGLTLAAGAELIVALLRTLRRCDERAALALGMLASAVRLAGEREVEHKVIVKRQQRQIHALREEIRRYTSRAVGERS